MDKFYSPCHTEYLKSFSVEVTIADIERIAFRFPARSDERVQLLWAVDQLKKGL